MLTETEERFPPVMKLVMVILNTALPPPATETPGVLKVSIDGDGVTAAFKPATGAGGRYEIHVARLGFALGADVTAGENSGRKLMHDFVVLGLTNEGMKS